MLPSRKRSLATAFTGTDRYRVLRLLGSGGMGEVYEVLDREHDARVAVKVLRNHDPHVLYRFKQEFRAVQTLQHRNLAALGQLHEDQGSWFFTMELIEGVDFLAHVTRRPVGRAEECADTMDLADADGVRFEPVRATRQVRFDEPRLRDGLRQLCEALHFLHGAGKIHRDIKPSNVMVTRDGRVVLLDFGLVASTTDELSDADIVGTPYYMAPEQATGRRCDQGVDCYALGVMLYEALTGDLPFTGRLTEILVKKQLASPPDPRERVAGLPDDLAVLCVRLLAPDPAQRPSAADVLEVLGGARSWGDTGSLNRPAIFLGRESELAALESALDDAIAAREPRVVHLEAESGVGKSALIEQFSASLRSARRRVRLLAGRCYEREMTHYRAFDGVVDALTRLMRRTDEAEIAIATPPDAWFLTRMFPMFGSVQSFNDAMIPDESASQLDARARAYAAFAHVLHALSSRRPLVIVVDDVQWADSDSLRLLAELLRGPGSPPVLWVLASRPLAADDPRGTAHRWLGDALKAPLRHVSLAPLPAALAERLAEQLLGDGNGAASAAAIAIAREAGGHPLHIAELVRHAAAGEAGRHLRLDEAIVHRLSRLPEAARQIADVLALAGTPLRPATLRQASGVAPLDFQRAIAELRIGNLAKRSGAADDELLEPYHDRVREAVAGNLDDARRRQLHARIATALTAADAAPELLIRHLEGAGALARAAASALDAAQRATTSMAYDRAAELYQTALRLGSYTADERRNVQRLLGEAFIRAGRGRAAAEVYAEAAVGADPDTRLECRLQSAEQLLLAGYIDDGLQAVDALLAEVATPLPATPRRALASLIRHRVALAVRGRSWTLRRESQVPREVLSRLDVYRAVSHGLSMVDNIRAAVFNSHYLRIALRTGEPLRLCRALGGEAIFRGSQGHLAGQDQTIAELEKLTAMVDAPYARAWLCAAEASREYFAGRFWSAAREFERAEELFRDSRTEASDIPTLRVLRGFGLMHAGEFARLRPLHAQWLAEAEERGDLYLQTVLRRAYYVLQLARGDVDGAFATLEQARWTSAPTGFFHLQHWYETQARVELALCRGAAAEAAPVIDQCMIDLRRSHLIRVQIVRCVATWLQARVYLAAARGPEAIARATKMARRAVKRLRGEGVSYAGLWAELLIASERSVAGDRDGATAALRAASALGVDDHRLYGTLARHHLAAQGAADAAALAADVAATCGELGIAELGPLLAMFTPCVRNE